MLKLIGSVCILVSTSYVGFYLSDKLRKRRDYLYAVCDALAFISAQIEFSHSDLGEIFKNIPKPKQVCGLFIECMKNLDRYGIAEAWELAVIRSGECLTDTDRTVLVSLGTELGMTDTLHQVRAIKRTIASIGKCADMAEAEYTRLAKPYRSCGVLVGIFFVIVLM